MKPDFWATKSIFPCHETRLKHEGGKLTPVINNGVDSMTTILQLIYREYCRSCLMHFRYL